MLADARTGDLLDLPERAAATDADGSVEGADAVIGDEARRAATWVGNIWDWLFLVRVHHRLNHTEQARQRQAQVDEWMARTLKKADRATRPQAEVLHREAKRLAETAKR